VLSNLSVLCAGESEASARADHTKPDTFINFMLGRGSRPGSPPIVEPRALTGRTAAGPVYPVSDGVTSMRVEVYPGCVGRVAYTGVYTSHGG